MAVSVGLWCWCIEVGATAAMLDLFLDQAMRTEFGRACSLIRFRMVTPMAASACWPGSVRA